MAATFRHLSRLLLTSPHCSYHLFPTRGPTSSNWPRKSRLSPPFLHFSKKIIGVFCQAACLIWEQLPISIGWGAQLSAHTLLKAFLHQTLTITSQQLSLTPLLVFMVNTVSLLLCSPISPSSCHHPSSHHSPRQLFGQSLLVFKHLAQWGEGPEHSSDTHKSR